MGQLLEEHALTWGSVMAPKGAWTLRVRKGTLMWMHKDREIYRFPLFKRRETSMLALTEEGQLCMHKFHANGLLEVADLPERDTWWCLPTGCTQMCTLDLGDDGVLYVRDGVTRRRTAVRFPLLPTNYPICFTLALVSIVLVGVCLARNSRARGYARRGLLCVIVLLRAVTGSVYIRSTLAGVQHRLLLATSFIRRKLGWTPRSTRTAV